MSKSVEISERNYVMRLSRTELILQGLGVIGLVIMLLVVLGVIVIIVYSMFSSWEYSIVPLFAWNWVTLI